MDVPKSAGNYCGYFQVPMVRILRLSSIVLMVILAPFVLKQENHISGALSVGRNKFEGFALFFAMSTLFYLCPGW